MWNLNYLKKINDDTSFIFYKKIINLNLSNDLIREFKKDFYKFKKMYYEKYLIDLK